MNTPITDAAAKNAFFEEGADDYDGYVAMLHHARRLETDRAALMKALKAVLKYSTPTASARIDATRILATARANFPIP